MKNVLARLKSLVKKKRKSVLNKIILFFSENNYSAYLVGGIIRDLLLNGVFVDIDIVVEDNIENIARLLNKKLAGELVIHKEFKTASIMVKDTRIDLAQSRKEFYPQPGSLPNVAPGSIIEDLWRRDFSINAVALGISRTNFGKVLDPTNGLRDIEKKTIRILHKGSFLDDPTRIFRALRYKNRLKFKLEKETEQLLKEAVNCGFIGKLSGQRILNEIKLIFTERSFRETIKDLVQYNIYKLSEPDIKILSKIANLNYYYFLSKIDYHNLPLKKEELKIINDLKEMPRGIDDLKKAKRTSEIYNILSGISDAVVEGTPFLYPSLKPKIRKYFALKKISPLISGDDLRRFKIQPGPRFGFLLKKAFELQIDRGINKKGILLKELQKWVKVSLI